MLRYFSSRCLVHQFHGQGQKNSQLPRTAVSVSGSSRDIVHKGYTETAQMDLLSAVTGHTLYDHKNNDVEGN